MRRWTKEMDDATARSMVRRMTCERAKPVTPEARYCLFLWDIDEQEWSHSLANHCLGGNADNLSFIESARAIMRLYRRGWSECTLLWYRIG